MKVTLNSVAAVLTISASTTTALIPSYTQQSYRSIFGIDGRARRSRHQPQHCKTSLQMSVVSKKEDEAASSSIETSYSAPSDAAHHNTKSHAEEKIANELSLGRTLDGGPVIDFGSVKDTSSRAEQALLAARQKFEASVSSGQKITSTSKDERLMGINDEVVAEVGYEIGTFVNEYIDESIGEDVNSLVQKCARYIRSKASSGTFSAGSADDSAEEFTPDEISRCNALLARAYDESGIVTSAFAKTFYLGTQVLPEPAMKAIWAVYVWCRRTDEIVDAPRPNAINANEEMLMDLSEWEIRTESLFERGGVVDVLDLPLLDCKVKYPALPIMPFSDMIRGMLMDIPELGQERYDTWDELHLYCYRVAGTVGLMSMPVFGCAPGFTDEIAK